MKTLLHTSIAYKAHLRLRMTLVVSAKTLIQKIIRIILLEGMQKTDQDLLLRLQLVRAA